MSSRRLADEFVSLAGQFGDSIAIIERDGAVVSYRQLLDKVNARRQFLHTHGITEGSRVALLMHKSSEAICNFLAVQLCGGCYIPLDPTSPPERIRFILEDSNPHGFLLHADLFSASLPCQHEMCLHVPGAANVLYAPLPLELPDADLAYVLYTSGSTGTPKGVCISHAAADAFVGWARKEFPLTRESQVASIAPFHFDLSVFDIYNTLLSGGVLHLFSNEQIRNPQLIAQQLCERRIDTVYATPTFFSTLLEFGKIHKHQWTHLKRVLFAGEVFPAKQLHALMNSWKGARYFNLYGPTETNVCMWTEVVREEQRSVPYPIGALCTGHSMELSPEGELFIGGPHVADRYMNQPELTAEKFFTRNGMRWFKTGDLVEADTQGKLVYKGRIDRMIKRRGYRIEPSEIEIALNKLSEVVSSAVVTFEKNDSVHVAACLILIPGKQADLITVKTSLVGILPDYMLPDIVVTREQFPLTSSGKIDYMQLREEVVSSFSE